MKKLISLILVLTLLAGIVPMEVLAAEDKFTLPQDEYQRTVRKVGMTNGSWHEGMSWSDSMSSFQKFCYLTDFRDNVVKPVKNRYIQAEKKAGGTSGIPAEASGYSLSKIKDMLFNAESALNYFIFDLETEVDAVANAEIVVEDAKSSAGDKAAAYRRIRKAEKRLAELDAELKNGSFPGSWQKQADQMNRQLDVFFDTYSAAEAKTAQTMKTLMGANEAKAVNGTRTAGGSSFEIIVLNADQIGVEVKDKNWQPVRDAKVTISCKSTSKTGYTDAKGLVIYPAGAFPLDDHNRMDAAMVVEKSGYRIWESQCIRIVAGDSVHAQLEEDTKDSYVQYVTFRGVDVAHDTEHVYSTQANDEKQSFVVGVHTYPGSTCTFSMNYTPAGSEKQKTISRTVKGVRDEVVTVDLADTWCAKLAPEEPVSLLCTNDKGEASFDRQSGITVEKAIVQKPLKSISASSSAIPGTSFDLDIPLGLPGMKNLRISMAIPWELLGVPALHFGVSINGDFYLSISVARMNKIINGVVGDEWKWANSKASEDRFNDFLSGRKTLTEIARSETEKAGAQKPMGNIFNTQLIASFCLMLNGKVTRRDNAGRGEDPFKGSLDLFVSAALDSLISFKNLFMVGPVPCYVGFDLGLGIQAGIDLPFTFTTDDSGIGAFSNWHNFAFDYEYWDIIVSPRASISAYVGAGVKGLAGIYIRGYVGFTINLHFLPLNDKKFRAENVLNASLQVIAEFLVWSVKATIWEKTWKGASDDNLSPATNAIHLTAGKGAGTDDPIHFTEADVTDLAMMTGLTEYRTVQCGKDFYAFWIEDKVVDGLKRPWLSCAKLETKNGRKQLTPVELPYLYVTHHPNYPQGRRDLNEHVSVADFDVTTTNDLEQHDSSFDMITLTVTFETARSVKEGYNKKTGEYYRQMITSYATDFYSIVFYANGYVRQYSTQACKFFDQSLDPVITGTNVSINYDTREVSNGRSTVYYNMTCTTVFNNAPTKVHCGEVRLGFIPDRSSHQNSEDSYVENTASYKLLDFSTAAAPLDELIQVMPMTRGPGQGSRNLYFALGTMKGTADEYGRKKATFLVRDLTGTVNTKIMTGDIACFRYMKGFGKNAGIFAMPASPNESGRYSLTVTDYTLDSSGRPSFSAARDLGVRVSPANFDMVDLGATRALYYLEAVTDNAEGRSDTGYNVRAVYLGTGSDGKIVSSSSFHLASFRGSDLNPNSGVPYMKLYTNDKGFVQGFLVQKNKTSENPIETGPNGSYVKFTDEKLVNLKYFTFSQTLLAEVLHATPEKSLVKPGDTINVMFTLMNTGNIPASKVTLEAYATKKGVSGRIKLADIYVDCVNPDASKVIQDGLPDLTGLEAVSQYDIAQGESKDVFLITENGLTTAVATNALMPDETHGYCACFNVPSSFKPGEYQIFVTFRTLSTRVMLLNDRFDSVSAWTKELYIPDPPPAIKPAQSSEEIYTLSMAMDEPVPLSGALREAADGSAVPVIYSVEELGMGPGAGEMYSAFSTSTYNDINEIPLEDADLSVTGRLSLEAGTETVHVVIRNEGMAEAKNIVFTALVDEDTTYQQSFPGVTLAYDQTISFDIPLSGITQGKEGENLILKVAGDSVETILENNEDVLPLNQSFMIIRHPADVFINEGSNAEFSVRARGGKKPYHYQWQVSTGGQYGPFKNINGATDQKLKLTDVPYKYNGQYYRVVITDAEGRVVTSNPALLVVTKLPPTGDRGVPWLWLGLLVAALPVMALLTRKKKRV